MQTAKPHERNKLKIKNAGKVTSVQPPELPQQSSQLVLFGLPLKSVPVFENDGVVILYNF